MTADPVELLRRLYVSGTEVMISEDGSLDLARHEPAAELLEEVRGYKAEIVAALREQGVGRNDDGFPSVVPRWYAVPPDCGAQGACARLGPCSRFLTRRPCHVEDEQPMRFDDGPFGDESMEDELP